jgi:hypothetical protein
MDIIKRILSEKWVPSVASALEKGFSTGFRETSLGFPARDRDWKK